MPEEFKQEFQQIDRELIKKKAYLDKRRELYSWSLRAEAVGIEQLPARCPTPGQRKEWEDSIVKAEGA